MPPSHRNMQLSSLNYLTCVIVSQLDIVSESGVIHNGSQQGSDSVTDTVQSFVEKNRGRSVMCFCWTVFTRNRDTAVLAEGNGDLQTLICVLVARPRRCLTLSNPVPWQNRMAAYLGYTLRMRTLFRGWPIMVNENNTHTRRKSDVFHRWCGTPSTYHTDSEIGRGCFAAVLLSLGQDSDKIELCELSSNLVDSVEAEVTAIAFALESAVNYFNSYHTVRQKNISSS